MLHDLCMLFVLPGSVIGALISVFALLSPYDPFDVPAQQRDIERGKRLANRNGGSK